MTLTTPKTDWTNGELVSADDMNEIGELLKKLLSPPPPPSATYTTPSDIAASPRWSDIDSDNLNFALNTTGGDVLAHFQGSIHSTSSRGHTVNFDLVVDGSRQSSGHVGLVSAGLNDDQRVPIGFTYLCTNLSAGPHTFKFQWSSNQGRGVKLKEDAQFWVREI